MALEVVPAMKVQEVEDVLKKEYSSTEVKVKKFPSYSNQNFYVEMQRNGQLQLCVFRIRNCIGITNGVELVRQAHMLQRYFRDLGVNVPLPIETSQGETSFSKNISYSDDNELSSAIEMVEFIPGKTIAELDIYPESFYQLCDEVGKLSGKVHAAMLKVEPKNVQENEGFVFYFQNTDLLQPMISVITNEKIKRFAQEFLDRFKSEIKPRLHEYRRCYIHNDMSDTNILAEKRDSTWKIGLIDFEDTHYGYLVSDLAICVAYMMGRGGTLNCDKNKVAQIIISSHERNCPLLQNEKDLLYDCVLARAIASYAAGQYLASKNEGKNDAHSTQANMFPDIIEMFCDKGRDKILKEWIV